MLPLDLGHPKQGRNELDAAREEGESRRFFVLADIAGLEPPGAVHRREPPAHAAETSEEESNAAKGCFAKPCGTRSEIVQHPADASSVLPLLRRDPADLSRFHRIAERTRMALIRKSRRQLAGVRSPENGGKLEVRSVAHELPFTGHSSENPSLAQRSCGTLVPRYANTKYR